MIQESVRSGRYPLATDTEKKFAGSVQVSLKSGADDLKAGDVAVEVRVNGFYAVNNYAPNIQHLPGVIEAEALDSYRMICRKIDRLDTGVQVKR
jgi:hypothetical protein